MGETIFWISIFVLYATVAFYWVWALFKGAPYYPSGGKAIKVIAEYLKEFQPNKVVELGAGDGRIALALAKEGLVVTAIEINPLLTLIMRLRIFLRRTKNVEVIHGDVFKQNFSRYQAAVIYLMPSMMAKLEAKLFSEMPKGSIIISNTFKFKQHEPKETREKVLVYEVA